MEATGGYSVIRQGLKASDPMRQDALFNEEEERT